MSLSSLPELLAQRPALALPAVFVGGVLTSLTPCIYPMIPITAAIVGGGSMSATSGVRAPRRRAVALTMAYVVGLALAYASLGLLAAMTGQMFGAVSTSPWLNLALANLLVLSALMLLDVIPVPVPKRMLARAAGVDGGGRIGGTFVMGAASGVVAAPCGAPVMATVLTWVAATHDAILGFAYLFVFSLGMSALLVVVGLAASGTVRLPRAGPWMVWVKRAFAALLIATAEYYLVQVGQLVV